MPDTELEREESSIARAHLANKRKAAELGKIALAKMETGLNEMVPPINPTGLSALAQATTQLFRMADGVVEHTPKRHKIARPMPTIKDALAHTPLRQLDTPAPQ